MKLTIDLETIGLPIEMKRFVFFDPSETKMYDNARIVQIGYIISDDNNNIIKENSMIIKPDNFEVKNEHVHHISQKIAEEQGQSMITVFETLKQDFKECDTIISHNLNFDYNVLMSEIIRYDEKELYQILFDMKKFCTMLEGQKRLKINKWPKLTHLVEQFFPNIIWNQKHEALDDAQYCFKCYVKLQDIK